MRSIATAIGLFLLVSIAIGLLGMVLFFPLSNQMSPTVYTDIIRNQSPKGTIYCGVRQTNRTLLAMTLFIPKDGVGVAGECRSGMRIIVPASQVASVIAVSEPNAETGLITVRYTANGATYIVQPQQTAETYQMFTVLEKEESAQ